LVDVVVVVVVIIVVKVFSISISSQLVVVVPKKKCRIAGKNVDCLDCSCMAMIVVFFLVIEWRDDTACGVGKGKHTRAQHSAKQSKE
jgi:hypothetical protein